MNIKRRRDVDMGSSRQQEASYDVELDQTDTRFVSKILPDGR